MIFPKSTGWVFACFVFVGCELEHRESVEPESSTEAPLVKPPTREVSRKATQTEPLYCGEIESEVEQGINLRTPEVYYPTAIKNKLDKFPQLRDSTKLNSVTNCEQARVFMSHYLDLVKTSPELFETKAITKAEVFAALPEAQDAPREIGVSETSKNGVASAKQAIRNGTVASSHYATVKISDPNGFCSAIQISKYHFLTSAHCLANNADGWIRAGITRQICNGTTCTMVASPYTDMWMYLTRYPDYTGNGDYPDDIAVATIYHIYDDGVTLPDPAQSDVLGMRLWLGSLSANQSTDIYGYGYSNESGAGAGGETLRVGTMNITTVNDGWFWARVVNQSVCLGDSGGPAVVNSNKAAGLPTQYSGSAVCPVAGAYVVWSAIAPKMSWIESVMAYPLGSGFTCTRYGSGTSLYARCW
jgi:hypothetical protein